MELGLSLLVTTTGACADVEVRAREGACLADVTSELLALVLPPGVAGGLSVAGQSLDPAVLLGAGLLVQGALVQVDPAGQAPPPARPPDLPPDPPPARWELHVVGGPAAGQVHPLAYGEVILGRGTTCGARLNDPRVSRAHCRLSLSHDGVRVTDLGSSNGTAVDQVAVGRAGADLPAAGVLRIGDSRLTVVRSAGGGLPVRPAGDARRAVNLLPRLRPPRARIRVVLPAPPPDRERSPLPVLAVLAPLVLGLVMWQLTDSATFLLFTLLSPVLIVGALVTERRTGARRGRREQALWAARRGAAERMLADAVRSEEQARRTDWPDAPQLLLTALGPGTRLWERRQGDGDLLEVRLGLADQPAQVQTEGEVSAPAVTARDVPVVVALTKIGVLGLAGDPARALARWVLVQAAVLHSPRHLQVVVLAEPAAAAQWSWVRWLPHTRPEAGQDCHRLVGFDTAQAAARVTELTALLEARQPGGGAVPGRWQPVLLVVDGARALRAVPGFARLLADGPAVGIHALCVETDARLLPAECGATAVLSADLCLRTTGLPAVVGMPDLVTGAFAETVSRALAPLCEDTADQGGPDGLPRTVRWAEAVGLPLAGGAGDAARVLARWAGCARSTSAVLGRSAEGLFAVDLVHDGPHALVAGTTGSGKSELLQTLVASLALANRPDELVLVLVDYKGGAAFGPCARLPHVVGLVTDLDGVLVERALASLGAELSRREAVLRVAGVKDLEDYLRLPTATEPLPRLVLVVDEFASLVEELPEFVGGLVSIAMRGRSLGVHLVLATQRPEAVVSADIRANTNLRLCLAVTRDRESRDVLDSPVAAAISRDVPGRAWARTGPAELTAFQSARVGGRRPRPVGPTDGCSVGLRPSTELGDPLPGPAVEPTVGTGTATGTETTDLDLLVEACCSAARQLGLPASRSPWLAPLGATVLQRDLPALPDRRAGVPGRVRPLSFGLLDVPAEQTRRTLALDLDSSTHLLVLGSARAGRSTVLRGLAGALADSVPADDAHLYAVDLGGALAVLGRLPHTGAVVGPDEYERLARLLDWLTGQVARRQCQLSAGGHTSLAEQRADSAPADRLPHLVLLIDRWEAFVSAYRDVDAGHLLEQVLGLLREGPAAGLHVVVSADRSGLVGPLATLIEDRLLLRLADPTDYAVAGLPRHLVPPSLGPGRGWLMRGGPLVAQVALLDPDPNGQAQTAALARLAAQAPAATRPPHRVEALPTAIDLTALPRGGTADQVVLGVGGDELEPVVLDLAGFAPGLLVAGPPGSGRSTTLLTVARGLQGMRTVLIAPRASPLRAVPGCLTSADEVEPLLAALGDGRVAVLIDDAELLVDSPVGELLEQVVRTARDRGTVLVAAGTTSELAAGYRGFVVALRRSRTGLLLAPETAADGDLLGVRLPRSVGGRHPPGRALLVRRGQVCALQVALP